MDDEQEIWTPAHEAARKQIAELLDKYFDGWLLLIVVNSEDGKDDHTDGSYNGGYHQALGLASQFIHEKRE